MNQKNEKDGEHFYIDTIAKELYGYDNMTLQKEMDEAEAAWEQQKAADPEAELQSLETAQRNFKAITAKIKEQDLKPVSRNAYAKQQKERRRKIINRKLFLKIAAVAAVLYLLLAGMAIEGVAFKKFCYRQEKVGTVKNKVVWNDEQYQVEAGCLEEAYQIIKEEIGIRVVKLGYRPEGLMFKGVFVDKGNARIMLGNGENVIYLRQTKYPVNNVSAGVVADQEHSIRVFNLALDCELLIQKNDLGNGQVEYWTDINFDEAYYYIVGIIDENEFIKMIEGLDCYE